MVIIDRSHQVIATLKQPQPEARELSRATARAVVYVPLTVSLRGYLCDGVAVTSPKKAGVL
nr:hypothetical protein [Mucilaginibacter sp. E4BP6]